MGAISLATMGKFCGPPTLVASAKFGGSGDGGLMINPKSPIVRVKSIQHKELEEEVTVTAVEES